MRKNNKGFTLTELLAVITLIIILTSIAVVAVSRYLNGSRTKAFSNDTIVIAEAALNKYSDDRLQENFNNDLFAGSVDGKRCYYRYSDPNYFTKIFKKQTGVTPSVYRKNNNKCR